MRLPSRPRPLPVVAALLLAAPCLPAQGAPPPPPPAIPADVFATPTGPYAVGTFDTLWVDAARPERLTRDPADRRHVPVQVWYPAARTGGTPAPYLLRPAEFTAQSLLHRVTHVRTHATLGAPVAPGGEGFPVLLYNHGGGWSRFTGTFVAQELASRGYVVVGIDHLGFDQSEHLANGYRFVGDTLGFPPPSGRGTVADARATFAYLESELFPTWVADAQFVLDRVEGLARDAGSPLRGRLDLARVGALGWSFGGATAVDLVIRDPRVRAAIDQDGQLFGMGRSGVPARPVLLMHNTSDPLQGVPPADRPALAEIMAETRALDARLRAVATGPGADLSIARTTHGHFSDLTLFIPPDSKQLPAARAHAIITAYTLAFFDRHLRGIGTGEPAARFPEVTLERWRQ